MTSASNFIRFGTKLKELRIHLCPKSVSSKGVRDFMESEYVKMKKINPQLPILVRECQNIQPKLWARYVFGRERCLSLDNYSKEQITEAIESFAQKMD